MATAADGSVTKSIRDDFLTCHICLEVFTDPRILPCLHTYCFQCICTHVDAAQADGRPAVCPDCRESFSSDTTLKSNFFVNGLIEVIKVKENKLLHCTACSLKGVESTAKVKCLDCGDYLCSTCSDGHNASSLTWKHEKIPLDDIKQGRYDGKLRQLQKIKCVKHKEKDVEFFCQSCSQPVCMACVLITHRDHTCETFADAVSHKKSSIQTMTKNIRDVLLRSVQKESSVSTRLESIRTKRKTEIFDIEKKANLKIKKINAKKEAEIKKLTDMSEETEQEEKHILEKLQLEQKVVASCLTFCNNILEHGRDDEILMLETMITQRLKQLQKMGVEEQELEPGQKPETLDHESLVQQEEQSGDSKAKHVQPTNACSQSESDSLTQHVQPTNACSQSESDSLTQHVQPTNACSQSESDSLTEIVHKFESAYRSIPESAQKSLGCLGFKREKIFLIQDESDSKAPDIKGTAFDSNIGLVLSDKANKCVKIYSLSGTLKNRITIENGLPFAVAIASCIIGVVSENFLCLFTDTGKLQHKILIHPKKPNSGLQFTFALAASSNEFIVGNIPNQRELRVYGIDATLKRLISCSIQFPLAALSVSPSGQIVTSEWGGACVKVMSAEGKRQIKCRRTPLWKPNQAVFQVIKLFSLLTKISVECVFLTNPVVFYRSILLLLMQ